MLRRRVVSLAVVLGLLGLVIVGSHEVKAGVASQGGAIGSIDWPLQTVWVTSSTNSVGNFGPGDYILGFKLIATADTANCDLYDTANLGGATTATVIDELAEVSNRGTAFQIWPRPYKLVTDLSIAVIDANCGVYF